MKIINQVKPEKEKIYTSLCKCGAQLEFNGDEIHKALYPYVICPACGEQVKLEDDEYDEYIVEYIVEPTVKNFRYPEDFFEFNNGEKRNRSEIEAVIRNSIYSMNINGDDYMYNCCGSTMIAVFKHDEGSKPYYVAMVAHGYEEIELNS